MKLVEVTFKLNEPLPAWQEFTLRHYAPLHVQVSKTASQYVWMLFRVPDDYEVPE